MTSEKTSPKQYLRRPHIKLMPRSTGEIVNLIVKLGTNQRPNRHSKPPYILLGAPVHRLQNLVLIRLIALIETPIPHRLPPRVYKIYVRLVPAVVQFGMSLENAAQRFLIDLHEVAVPRHAGIRVWFVLRIRTRIFAHEGLGHPLLEALAEGRSGSPIEGLAVFDKSPFERVGDFGSIRVLKGLV